MKKHVTICGSMTFSSEMKNVALKLEALGFSVTYPKATESENNSGYMKFTDYIDSLGGVENIETDDEVWKIKKEAMKVYKEEIDNTDAILVCNFDKKENKNYIGQNSFLEMGYAFFINKPIFILLAPPYCDNKIEEILGMLPVFLYGDINKLTETLN